MMTYNQIKEEPEYRSLEARVSGLAIECAQLTKKLEKSELENRELKVLALLPNDDAVVVGESIEISLRVSANGLFEGFTAKPVGGKK